MEQKHDKAIVTLAIGEAYTRNFLQKTYPNWEKYCARHGYDLVMVSEPIDGDCDFARKSFHWQKLLVGLLPQVQAYDRVVWLDGDILINHRLAPCIVAASPADGIGAVDISDVFRRADEHFNLHARFLVLNYLMTRALDPATPDAVVTDGNLAAYHRRFGLTGEAERFINTGVLVFDPRRDAPFLAEVYARYDRDFVDFENTPLSHDLQVDGRVRYIDRRFNTIWAQVAAEHYPFLFNPALMGERHAALARLCAHVALRNTWFLHFAGGGGNPLVKGAFETADPDGPGVVEAVFPQAWPGHGEFLQFARLADLAPGSGGTRRLVLY
ncbi:MAG: hypothetical protein H6907_18090 [Hyphomicrobiales bacterium]|nr:hypothetical protein [Hyphomicrobiales bacterium]MCP5373645.1 hypothetical protein [Hyphomicrobiales bacterium]